MSNKITFGELNATHLEAEIAYTDGDTLVTGKLKDVSHYENVTLINVYGQLPKQRRQTHAITIVKLA